MILKRSYWMVFVPATPGHFYIAQTRIFEDENHRFIVDTKNFRLKDGELNPFRPQQFFFPVTICRTFERARAYVNGILLLLADQGFGYLDLLPTAEYTLVLRKISDVSNDPVFTFIDRPVVPSPEGFKDHSTTSRPVTLEDVFKTHHRKEKK